MPSTHAFGSGSVEIADDGSVAAVTHPDGVRPMLLQEGPGQVESPMHEPAFRWGKGFVITDRGSARWSTPTTITPTPDGVDLTYALGELELRVTRRIGETWLETYALVNTGERSVAVGSFAISTPWRDVYGSSRDCLDRAVHAHIWAGGADAWVWAEPMSGARPVLGLTLTEGEVWAYSVESRDATTGSNVRGHLYLHTTDHARAPHAMGGQPEITLAPGEQHRVGWRLRWYGDDHSAFVADRAALLDAPVVAAATGESIMVTAAEGVTLSEPSPVTATVAGERSIIAERAGRRSRVNLLFHPPLRELVQARVRFVLDRQRPVEEPGSRAAAFVPYDNASGLRVLPGAWRDWNDARERVGTAILLQQARDHDLGDRAEIDAALEGYTTFVGDHLLAADGTVADDSRHRDHVRLYNFSWFARFLLGQGDLDAAVLIMDRYYALGGDHFLAFDLGPLLRDLAGTLTAAGRPTDADRMRGHLLGHAAAMIEHGEDLPKHEVNYEQSMVAPLVELLLSAHLVDPAAVPADELLRRVRWLAAFGSDQPDARVRHVPIRHWDGYWFGSLRLWGDVFPHYWSCLNATVYLSWPESLGGPGLVAELGRRGEAILRSNLAAFDADGSATCAFVYPSAVNGRPAHVADPLANDQDWALVYALRYGYDRLG